MDGGWSVCRATLGPALFDLLLKQAGANGAA